MVPQLRQILCRNRSQRLLYLRRSHCQRLQSWREQSKRLAAKRAAKDAQHHRRRRRDAAAAAAKAAKFEDSDELASLKALIEKGDFDGVDKAIKAKPDIVHMRSADGQGPLFWSYAAKNKKIRKLLIKNGAQKDVVDKNGKTPKQAKK